MHWSSSIDPSRSMVPVSTTEIIAGGTASRPVVKHGPFPASSVELAGTYTGSGGTEENTEVAAVVGLVPLVQHHFAHAERGGVVKDREVESVGLVVAGSVPLAQPVVDGRLLVGSLRAGVDTARETENFGV
jgi:hypothetical protein